MLISSCYLNMNPKRDNSILESLMLSSCIPSFNIFNFWNSTEQELLYLVLMYRCYSLINCFCSISNWIKRLSVCNTEKQWRLKTSCNSTETVPGDHTMYFSHLDFYNFWNISCFILHIKFVNVCVCISLRTFDKPSCNIYNM